MDYTFFSLETETTKFPILHSKPYPAFFTPRTKKPSHLSSGKTSSKFDLLEIKIEEKIKWVGKAEQSSVYYFLQNYTKCCLWEKLLIYLLKENYNRLYREAIHPSC